MLFDYFVGSTDTHRAHSDSHAFDYLASQFPGTRSQRVWGLWEGRTEDTVQYTVDLPSDAVAQRVAVALAALTGNDAVLVSRLVQSGEDTRVFDSQRHYFVSVETRTRGNRTLLADPFATVRVGQTITTYAGTGEITRIGSCAGFFMVRGKETRFDRHDIRKLGYGQDGVAYVPDVKGSHIAFLAWTNGTISAVTA